MPFWSRKDDGLYPDSERRREQNRREYRAQREEQARNDRLARQADEARRRGDEEAGGFLDWVRGSTPEQRRQHAEETRRYRKQEARRQRNWLTGREDDPPNDDEFLDRHPKPGGGSLGTFLFGDSYDKGKGADKGGSDLGGFLFGDGYDSKPKPKEKPFWDRS